MSAPEVQGDYQMALKRKQVWEELSTYQMRTPFKNLQPRTADEQRPAQVLDFKLEHLGNSTTINPYDSGRPMAPSLQCRVIPTLGPIQSTHSTLNREPSTLV